MASTLTSRTIQDFGNERRRKEKEKKVSFAPFRLEVFVPAHEVDGVGGEVAAVDGERGALEPLEQGKHRIAGAAPHL